MKRWQLLLSCEHAGKQVPRRYAALFAGRAARKALQGHRGHDIGALAMARMLQRRFAVPLFTNSVTRLLVETNRSEHHRGLFSEYAQALPESERLRVLDHYYRPHRGRVEAAVRAHLGAGESVLHVAVHTFTPRLGGSIRRADVGLLYDPTHSLEAAACATWKRLLGELDPDLRVRRNYPYRGADDGLTTHFRGVFGDAYLGVEIETNQALAESAKSRRRVTSLLAESLERLLTSLPQRG